MKVAVIGSGISGLAAAFFLRKEHEVTLLERGSSVGMDAHSVELETSDGPVTINAPMRVFYEGYYPELTRLYRQLGIEFEPVKYSGSFSEQHKPAYFHYKNHWFGNSTLPFLSGRSLLNRKSWKLGAELLKFLFYSRRSMSDGLADTLTFKAYLHQVGASRTLAEKFLYPTFAGICTCSYENIKAYPAKTILGYLHSDLTFSRVNRLRHGARDVVNRLSDGITLRCRFNADSVSESDGGVVVTDTAGNQFGYDHVVVAVQANQALALLSNSHVAERSALKNFNYERSCLIVHRSPTLAPQRRADWAPVNFVLSEGCDKPMASIWLNSIYPQLGVDPVFETWNPLEEPSKDEVLIDTHVERPLVTAQSLAAVRELEELHGDSDRRVWFCGSYLGHGIPLLESAVTSAKSVARRLAEIGAPNC